jgi:uncharacterized protein (TIGR03437 family)
LALTTISATSSELPTNLESTTVTITDNTGNAKMAPLFYVSPTQINFQIPAGLSNGVGTITINLANQIVATGVIALTNTAPGFFTANQTGTGLAAATVQRFKADGAYNYESITRFDPALQQVVALPINVNPGVDMVYLNLYGTGIRGRSDLANIKAKIGGVEAQVTYAGAHGSFVGVDQINVLVPPGLAGKGEVEIEIMVEGKAANPVKLTFQ